MIRTARIRTMGISGEDEGNVGQQERGMTMGTRMAFLRRICSLVNCGHHGATSGQSLGRFGDTLKPSWCHPGGILGPFGGRLGAIWALEGNLGALLRQSWLYLASLGTWGPRGAIVMP